jgi:hypothetical protein
VTADPRVARLRSLDTEATPGPWQVRDINGVSDGRGYDVAATLDGSVRQAKADAVLVATMRNTWPAVVTLLEGVLGRHKPGALTLRYCAACSNAHPCPDRTDALAVLDTLDPP